MKKKGFIIILSIVALLIILLSVLRKPSNKEGLFVENDSVFFTENPIFLEFAEQGINHIAKNIASPVEIAATLRDYEFDYNPKLLLELDLSDFVVAREKAVALGGIGVDLMYVNFYEKAFDMPNRLLNINRLSQELYLSQFFDYELLKELTSSALTDSKIDSIMFISTYNLNSMQNYLLDSEKLEIGVYMILGAWTEGIHLLANTAKNHEDERLYERLAEQKFFMEQLMMLLTTFEADKNIKKILQQIKPLHEAIFNVKFEYKDIGEPVMRSDRDGNEVMYQYQSSHANVNQEQVLKVAEEVDNFRNALFQL